MICRHCGAELKPNDRFCPGCGAPIDAPKAERTPKENTQAEKDAKKAQVTALAAAAQNGDEQSFSELYRMFYQKVFALAKTTVKTDADAEDVLQLTFIRAWNSIGNLKNPEAFSTWIQRITLNQCYSLLRSRHVEVSIDESEEDDESFGPIRLESDLMLPEVYAERSDLRARLGRIIDGLSSVQKQTITLYYYDGLPVENIAWIMDCSVNTVKSRLFLARRSIKTEIEEQERRSGQPFFGVVGLATVPFGKLFVEHVTTMSIPKAAAANALRAITQHISETAAKSAEAAQMRASTAGSAAKQSAKTAAKGTVKVGAKTAAKAAASAVSKKVITGIIAGVLITGAVAGGTVAAVHTIREKQSAEAIVENTPVETDRSNWRLIKEESYDPAFGETDYTIYAYDESGNRISKTTYRETHWEDASHFSSNLDVYEYDAYDNLVSRTLYDADGAVNRIRFENEYDADGHLIEVSEYNSGDHLRNRLVYRYDEHGNVIEESGYHSGKKTEYTYEYDADGNVLKKAEYYDGIIRESTEYRANGVIVRNTTYCNGEISERSEYDASGKLTEELRYEDGEYVGSHYFKYEYDANGWLTKEIETFNKKGDLQRWADYTYDAYGNCIMVTRYDPTNGLAPDGFMGWTKYEWEYIGSEPLPEVPLASAASEPTAKQPAETPAPTHAEAKTYPPRYQTISSGANDYLALADDGTVLGLQQDIPEPWNDIVSIAAGCDWSMKSGCYVLGLRSDGTVLANYWDLYGVTEWTDIVEISAGGDHALGRKADGTVVACGINSDGRCDVSDWTNVVAIAAGSEHSVGLRSDGTVVTAGNYGYPFAEIEEEISGWTDIVAITAGRWFTAGLKSDGTVVVAGRDAWTMDLSDLTDIVAISAGTEHLLGLKRDGTVVMACLYMKSPHGNDAYTQRDYSGWTDIVAIAAGVMGDLGLKADGTLVTAGDGYDSVSGWSGIRMP